MSRATPYLRDFAQRLMVLETRGAAPSATKLPAGFPVCEKLHPHLARLMGNGGFRILLSRALVLGSTEVRWLRAVQVKADGSLEAMEELQTELTHDEFFEGSVELLAQLLGLLVAFIGENLTLRLLGEVWPELSSDLTFGKGGENEKAK